MEPISAAEPSVMVTGRDSPVSAAWSTWMGLPASSLQSAGTAWPAPNSTMSPGTTSPALMVMHSPLRFTVASGFNDFFSDAIALPACA